MKFDCGETGTERYDRLSTWHPWFAWYPVKVADHDCRWLEKVQRMAIFGWGDRDWKYKAMEAE